MQRIVDEAEWNKQWQDGFRASSTMEILKKLKKLRKKYYDIKVEWPSDPTAHNRSAALYVMDEVLLIVDPVVPPRDS